MISDSKYQIFKIQQFLAIWIARKNATQQQSAESILNKWQILNKDTHIPQSHLNIPINDAKNGYAIHLGVEAIDNDNEKDVIDNNNNNISYIELVMKKI